MKIAKMQQQMQSFGFGNSSGARLGLFHHTVGLSSSHTNKVPYLMNFNSSNSKPNPKIKKLRSYKANQEKNNRDSVEVRGKKENVWTADNEIAKSKQKELAMSKTRRRGRRRRVPKAKGKTGQLLVSPAMLMEIETLLQTQVLLLYCIIFYFYHHSLEFLSLFFFFSILAIILFVFAVLSLINKYIYIMKNKS